MGPAEPMPLPSTCSRTSGIEKANIAWAPTKDAYSPWQYEWNVFIDSKRINGLYRAVIKYEKL
jgi:hypothetical protein